MKLSNAIILSVIGCAALGAACGSNATVNTNPSNTTTVANSAKPASNQSNQATAVNAEKTPEKTSNAAPATPTAVYKGAHAARKNKDVETLKKLMSKDILEFMTIMSEGDSPDKAILQMTETPQAATDESRNEKISGETATLEYPDANGNWKTMDFVREDGAWKMTIPKPGKSEKFEDKKTK